MKTLQELFAERNRLFKEKCNQVFLHGGFCVIDDVPPHQQLIDPQFIESFNQETQQLAVEWMLEKIGEDEIVSMPNPYLGASGLDLEMVGRNAEKEKFRSLLKQIIT